VQAYNLIDYHRALSNLNTKTGHTNLVITDTLLYNPLKNHLGAKGLYKSNSILLSPKSLSKPSPYSYIPNFNKLKAFMAAYNVLAYSTDPCYNVQHCIHKYLKDEDLEKHVFLYNVNGELPKCEVHKLK